MNEPKVERWLREFGSKSTKGVYLCGLKSFRRQILKGISYEKAIFDYRAGRRDVMNDLQRFFMSFQDKPSQTRNSYTSAVRMFLGENGVEIKEADWKKKTRRLRRSIRGTRTADDIPTVEQLRLITETMNLKGRSLTLFLASTGCRIGETLQLTTNDLRLDADPPRATLRAEYTKFGESGRTVFMSYEARDALKDWLRMSKRTAKKTFNRGPRKTYASNRVWNMSISNARYIWNNALATVGLGKRDMKTNVRVFHLHTLRKFFRSNIDLPSDITHALMGHRGYLDRAYQRVGVPKLARMYSKAMSNVSVFSAPQSRKAEIRKFMAMSGVGVDELLQTLNEMMYAGGEGSGGGMSRKLPIDEEYLYTLDDGEIGKLIRASLVSGVAPEVQHEQKVVPEGELESYLTQGWRYVSSLNNGSNKCIVEKA